MKMRLPLLIICTRCRSRGGHVLMSTCDALSAAGAYVLTQASVRTRALPLSPSNALLLTRSPLAAHAAGIAQSGRISRSCVRADARSSHARLRMCTLSRQHAGRRAHTRPRTRCHSIVLTHALSLSSQTLCRSRGRRAQHAPSHALSHGRAGRMRHPSRSRTRGGSRGRPPAAHAA